MDASTNASLEDMQGTSFVVHGHGNVGGTVAREHLLRGAIVYVHDFVSERTSANSGDKDRTEGFAAAGPGQLPYQLTMSSCL